MLSAKHGGDMDTTQIVDELTHEVARIRSDVSMMEKGVFKLSQNGIDVTAAWMERHKSTADRLDSLIEAYKQRNA
jgi:hypothetical protein